MAHADTIEQTDTNEELEIKEPSKYQVLLHNDNKTTFNFVIAVLEQIFFKSFDEAKEITIHVHELGIGIAGIYTKEIAEEKVETSTKFARQNGFPLVITAEEV